jgi:hypothetical protein
MTDPLGLDFGHLIMMEHPCYVCSDIHISCPLQWPWAT